MEITNNQNAESFVVRELTEKSNGNAKYFLLSKRAEQSERRRISRFKTALYGEPKRALRLSPRTANNIKGIRTGL